jgi:hypothetical protein
METVAPFEITAVTACSETRLDRVIPMSNANSVGVNSDRSARLC